MNYQQQFGDEDDVFAILSACIPEAVGAEFGIQKLEKIMNCKDTSFATKIESLIHGFVQVRKCHLDIHGEYVLKLMEWLKLHTLNIVLNGEWTANKKLTGKYEEELLKEINNCELYLFNAHNGKALQWEKLENVIKNPWGNEYLNRILNGVEKTVGPEAFKFFGMEAGHLLSTRLKQLCEYSCENLALNLLKVFMQCHRLSEVENVSLNVNLNQIRYFYDIYLALLFGCKKFPDIITAVGSISLVEGLKLITRFAKKNASTLKIWENSPEIIKLVGVECMTEIVSKSSASAETLEAFLEIWVSVININDEKSVKLLKDSMGRIIQSAESAILIYPFCEVMFKKFRKQMKMFVVELYIRALTTDMNIMEREKLENETENLKETAKRLSNGFLRLADVLDEHVKVSRECVLTAFSLVPTRTSLDKIIALAVRSGYESIATWPCKYHPPNDSLGDKLLSCKECGEYISEVKKTQVNINTALSEALIAEEIDLSHELCDDLAVLLSCSRYQFLNWVVPWIDLYRLCMVYLDDAEGTRNFVKDLKYVEIDYSLFSPINGNSEKNDGWIYEPYLADVSRKKSALGTQGICSNVDIEMNFFHPQSHCSKSNPEVIKALRQFRRTSKRAKSLTLDSEPPEKVYLPSNSASITSSIYSDSPLDYSNKKPHFFRSFIYSKNADEESKLIPSYKKQKTTSSSTSIFPNNIFLKDITIEKNVDTNPDCTTRSTDFSSPIDYSMQSKSMNNSDLIIKRSINNSKGNTNYSSNSSVFLNESCLEFLNGNINQNLTKSTDIIHTIDYLDEINFYTPFDYSMQSQSANNSEQIEEDIKELKQKSSCSNNNSCSNQSFIESMHTYDSTVNKKLSKNNEIYNDLGCLNEINCSNLNGIIEISDSEESIDSDLEINELENTIEEHNHVHKNNEFYCELMIEQEVELDSKKQNAHIKFNSSDRKISKNKQNFHMERETIDNAEDKILVTIKKLEDADFFKKINLCSLINRYSERFKNAVEENKISSNVKIGAIKTEGKEYLNFSEKVSTFLLTKSKPEIFELLSTIEYITNCNKEFLKIVKQNSIHTSGLDTNTAESKVNDFCNMVWMMLKYICKHCKRELDILEETSLATVDFSLDKKIFSVALNCITTGHCSNINTQSSSGISTCRSLFQNDNILDVKCVDVLKEISQSSNQLSTPENNVEKTQLNESKGPLNMTDKSITVSAVKNCATLDCINFNKLNVEIKDIKESCDMPANAVIVSESCHLQNVESKSTSHEMADCRLPFLDTNEQSKVTSLHVNRISDFKNLTNSPPRTLGVFESSSTLLTKKTKLMYLKKDTSRPNSSRPKRMQLRDSKTKYYLRYASLMVNERKTRKRNLNYLQNACVYCCAPNKKQHLNTKSKKSENIIKQKIEIENKSIEVTHNKTSPLQDINPKVFSKPKGLKKCNFMVKQKCDTRIPYVILNRLEFDLNKDNINSSLLNIPGLRDLQLIKPGSVDHIVQVVQVPGGQCVPVQANMTQISPHIQRIGHSCFQDNSRLRRKPLNCSTCAIQVASPGNASENQLKDKKPLVHTYRGRTKNIRKGSRLSNKNVPIELVPHKNPCKQGIIQKDLHLQKSLSEECADLGVDEPSTTDLFPEADLMYDSTNLLEQSSLPVVRKVSQSSEFIDEPKQVGLFCDIEPVRTDSFIDSFECQTEILQFHFEGLTNRHYSSDTAIDNTLLQTSLSADEVTIPDPREGNTSPSSIYKYECIYTNCKKNEKDAKVKEKFSVAAHRNFRDKSSIALEFVKNAKIVNTNQSSESYDEL